MGRMIRNPELGLRAHIYGLAASSKTFVAVHPIAGAS
jgi:hypothetical protein